MRSTNDSDTHGGQPLVARSISGGRGREGSCRQRRRRRAGRRSLGGKGYQMVVYAAGGDFIRSVRLQHTQQQPAAVVLQRAVQPTQRLRKTGERAHGRLGLVATDGGIDEILPGTLQTIRRGRFRSEGRRGGRLGGRYC